MVVREHHLHARRLQPARPVSRPPARAAASGAAGIRRRPSRRGIGSGWRIRILRHQRGLAAVHREVDLRFRVQVIWPEQWLAPHRHRRRHSRARDLPRRRWLQCGWPQCARRPWDIGWRCGSRRSGADFRRNVARYRLHRIDGIDLLFQLLAELAGHVARAPHPAADLLHQTGQFLRAQHHQGHAKDDRQLGNAEVEETALPGSAAGARIILGTWLAAPARRARPPLPETPHPASAGGLAGASAAGSAARGPQSPCEIL